MFASCGSTEWCNCMDTCSLSLWASLSRVSITSVIHAESSDESRKYDKIGRQCLVAQIESRLFVSTVRCDCGSSIILVRLLQYTCNLCMRTLYVPTGMDGGTPSSGRPLFVRADTHCEISVTVLLKRGVKQIRGLVIYLVTLSGSTSAKSVPCTHRSLDGCTDGM
jgi:hypothetical protein